MKIPVTIEKRTLDQNRAIHKLFTMLSDNLNTLGLGMKDVLKPTTEIWWTPEAVKEYLWRPLQKAMLQKESTTELTTVEVSRVYKQLAHIIGEKHGVEIEFPSAGDIENYETYQ
jgi:hypothetical protein